MKRATITIPDDLERELDAYLAEQDAPPSITSVVQAALRVYLEERKWKARGYHPATNDLNIPIAQTRSGRRDISVDHDKCLTQ